MLENEDKKDSFNSDARNDLLAQALGKLLQTDHMQGLGKIISASMHFHCQRGPIQNEKERELDVGRRHLAIQNQ